MNNRYSKYFLEHVLWLKDDFCHYYLQDPMWGRKEILDVEHVIFFFEDDARQWLDQCAEYDHWATLYNLRSFLSECLQSYPLHRMTDQHVLHAAADEICRRSYRVVIKPRYGYAVNVNARTAEPKLPITVQEEPDLDSLMAELKTELDALVAEQQKNADQIEARLAEMNDAQKAALYGKKAGDGVWDATGGGLWDMVKMAGSVYVGYLKTVWKIAQTPDRIARATTEAIMTGSTSPFKDEIDKIVTPVAQTYEQAKQYKSMLTILLGEPQVYELLYDFAERYYKATHPAELTQIGASVVTDIIVTILLAIFTAGTGAAANIAAKSPRLVKIFKLLEKITAGIRRIDPRSQLLSIGKDAARKAGKAIKSRVKSPARGVPEIKRPKKNARPPGKLDNRMDKGDDGPKNKDRDKKEKKRTKSTKEQIGDLKKQGHGPQRHEGQLTEKQLDERVRKKFDPETGTREDKYRKNSDGSPANHRCGDHATKVNSEESYARAESHSRNSDIFKEKSANGDPAIKVEIPLEEIFGPEYKTHVYGRTRTLPWPDTSSPTIPTDFTDGKMVAIYRKSNNGNYDLITMYPNPI